MSNDNTNDNTKPEFFALWSLRDLQIECARLNQVLTDCSEASIEILEKAYPKSKDTKAKP